MTYFKPVYFLNAVSVCRLTLLCGTVWKWNNG